MIRGATCSNWRNTIRGHVARDSFCQTFLGFGQTKDLDSVRKMMVTDIAGEIALRSVYQE